MGVALGGVDDARIGRRCSAARRSPTRFGLRDRPVTFSRFGPTDPDARPARLRRRDRHRPDTAHVELSLTADVDVAPGRLGEHRRRPLGDERPLVGRRGRRLDARSPWRPADLDRRLAQGPGGGWVAVDRTTVDDETLDLQVAPAALRQATRTTAEDRGLEFIEGAKARHCRIAIDGPTALTAFPEMAWFVGSADLHRWRGELDFWVFADRPGRAGRARRQRRRGRDEPDRPAGHDPGDHDRHRSRPARSRSRRPAERRRPILERDRFAGKRDRVARLLRIVRYLQERGEAGARPGGDRPRGRDVAPDRLPRPARDRAGDRGPRLVGERPLGPRGQWPAAAAQAHPRRGTGRLPLRPPDGPLCDRPRSRPDGRLPEARLGDAGRDRRARREHARRHGRAAAGRGVPASGPAHHPGLGRATGRRAHVRHGRLRAGPRATDRAGAAVPHRAVILDPRALPHRLGRDPRRDADVQDRADPRARADDRPVRGADARGDRGDAGGGLGHHRGPGTDRGRAALRDGGRRAGSPRRTGIRRSPARSSPTARSSGGPRSPARSRSGCGSCPGAPTWRSSRRRPCGARSPDTLEAARGDLPP